MTISEPQATREAVLDAALAVFTEHTYGGAAMSVLASRAGVAVGTIYRHFPSKEALGNAVYRRWKVQLGEHLFDDADAGSIRAEFGRIWRGMLRFAAAHPDAFAFLELQQHGSYLDAESVEVTRRIEQAGAAFVVRGQQTGEIRDGDPAVLVALVYGAFVGLAATDRAGAGLDEGRLQLAEDAVWDMLRAR
ncbi:TetR/AcrR family transcriptional regulator [Virgisporangium aurantiacum]|uniref:TetR family transcriptional regulator n=1 Tax=Virgisporangium aurantiacum TaxID=175570 RepID=A0A8J3Z8L9_9ACTN|nr:TetR/AcrR family transcriptional regulator [Virgisporangium aurantiacum]GIJ57300.1 TetR family transcriptional regulator [Virgisporangium aurantiacum]